MPSIRFTPEQLAAYRKRYGLVDAETRTELEQQGSAFWPIRPVPAPRQSQRDAWNPKARVKRYRAFCDAVVALKVWAPTPGDLVVFCMPIPKSRQDEQLEGMPHLQVPDADNLLKALLDACYADDAHIWTVIPAKVWHPTGGIYIERRAPVLRLPFCPAEAA